MKIKDAEDIIFGRVKLANKAQPQHSDFNYKRSADLCDLLKSASDKFAEDWKTNPMVIYNAFLSGANIQEDYDKAHADKLAEALRELVERAEAEVDEQGLTGLPEYDQAYAALAAYEAAQ